MRCKNCGWDNPSNVSKCEKCNAPLSGSMIDRDKQPIQVQEPTNLNSTVRESEIFGSSNAPKSGQQDGICRKCGYPLAEGMNVCPQCGTPTSANVRQENETKKCPKCGSPVLNGAKFCVTCGHKLGNPLTGTVRSWDTPNTENHYCTLKPIAWSREEVQYNPITYSGDVIVLNRSNTDPNNNSITSQEQAVLICEDGKWYLEDRSSLKSTFIQVNHRVKLESGDVILLGNRQFIFKG